jgi:hypothetical protein
MQNESKRRLFKSKIAIALLGIMLCTPSLSLGWGAGGHMMVASIAFKRLTPKAKAQAIALLARPINPAAETNKSKDFVNASHWADDVKRLAGFEFSGDLHFIDKPFATDSSPLPTDLPKPNNIVKALQDYVNILKTSTDKDEQAQALRFIIHFVGDIHQPLHAATRVDSTHLEGDEGGNKVTIKVAGKSVKLHSYWDGGIGTFPKTRPGFVPPPLSEIPPAVAKALAGNPPSDPELKLNDPFNYDAWADESFALAQSTAYKGMKNGVTPSATYNKNALKVARQRVAWGGYRLAALLNAIWP